MEMEGRVALVTGAGSGIGAATARLLAREGAHVLLLGRTRDELSEVAESIAAAGGDATVLLADVSSEAQMRKAFERIGKAHGRLDAVLANAGVNGTWAPLSDLSYADWNSTMAINLGGTFLTLQLAIPLMQEHGGSVAITASINGTRTFTSAGASAYATTKAGQVALAKMAALELARYRIRVNVICPGAISTEIDDNTDKKRVAKAKMAAEYPNGTVPLTGGEPGTAEDVAELALFLLSSRSRHITGTPIWIDGAQSLLV